MTKTIIIGGSHAGQMAAREIKRFDPQHEVMLIEKETVTPFVASGINLVFHEKITDLKQATAAPGDLAALGVVLAFGCEVTEINWEEKAVIYTDGRESFQEAYDELILATGSNQLIPQEWADLESVYVYKSYQESRKTLAALEEAERIVISGTGYVGVELAEALTKAGKEVTLVGPDRRILKDQYDPFVSEWLTKAFQKSGTICCLESSVLAVQSTNDGLQLQLADQSQIECDALVIAYNSRPVSDLYWQGLHLAKDKTVLVDEHLLTSQKDVYAIGDLIALPDLLAKGSQRLSLVSEAWQTARVAALNIAGQETTIPKHLSLSATRLFDQYLGSVGLTKEQAENEQLDFDTIQMKEQIADQECQLCFHITKDQRLIGAQIMSGKPVQTVMDLLAVAIKSRWRMVDYFVNDPSFYPMDQTYAPMLIEMAGQYLAKQSTKR